MRAKIQACYLPILAQYVAVEDVRYYLQGFFIEPAPIEIGGCYLVAMNGEHMVLIHDKLAESDGIYIIEIPKHLLAGCKYESANQKNIYKIHGDKIVSFDGNMANLEYNSGVILSERCKPIDGKYPEWRKVLPRERVATENIIINPKYLSVADSALKKSGLKNNKYSSANIEMFGSGKCIAFFPSPNSDKHRIMIIIMLMREDGTHSVKSDWVQGIDKRWLKPVPPPALCTEFPEPNAMGFYEHGFGVVGVDSEAKP